MCPKPRNAENRALPQRWRYKHGAFYYRVPNGAEHQWDKKTEFRLGKTQVEAYKVWASRIEFLDSARTINDLLERYEIEEVPKKSPKTQESYLAGIKNLRLVFGNMLITSLKTVHVFKYRDKRSKQAPTATNHEIALLSHVYSKAIEWGLVEDNPIKGKVTKIPRPPRNRYIEDWELTQALKVASPFLKNYIKLKLQLGLRRGDMLRIRYTDLLPEGIAVTPRKTYQATGKQVIYLWTTELRQTIESIRALNLTVQSDYLFCTRNGDCYMNKNGRSNSFDSLWQRFMKKALNETALTERFTEHDLRAKVASDNDLERAQQLLMHTSSSLTQRVYRRKPELILPSSFKH